jgi:tetratricopeptide (TPR) repeat protein
MAHGSALLGRDAELGRLRDSLDGMVGSGTARVVFITGEAGIGKSALLDAFEAEAAARYTGSDLLIGRGQALMNSSATDSYQVVRESLRDLSRSAGGKGALVLRRVAGSFVTHAPDWAESVPLIGGLISAGLKTAQTMTTADARPTDAGLSEQFAGLVESLCAEQPVVLILDDLHWADSDTINALTMIERKAEGPLLLVLAFRPYGWEGEGRAQPLRTMIDRIDRYRTPVPVHLHLTALGDEHIRAIIDASGEHTLDAAAVERMTEQSGGNPLFAGELVRSSGHRLAVPGGIAGVLGERLDTLDRQDLQLLEKAAVVGFRFEVDHLVELSGLTESALYDRLDALLEDELLEVLEPAAGYERYQLRHPLIGELLTSRIARNPPRSRFLHAGLLEILEQRLPWDDATAIRAASVADRAGLVDQAARYAYAAAERQSGLGAIGKARELAEVAVRRARQSASAAAEGRALVLLAECLTAEGAHASAAERCLEALELLPSGERGAVLFLRSRNLRMQQDWVPARRGLEEILAAEAPSGLLAKSTLLLAEIMLTGPDQDLPRVITLCDDAERLSSDPQIRLRAIGHRGLAQLAAGEGARAEQTLNQAADLSRTFGDPYAEYEAVHWLAKKHLAALELDRAGELLARLGELTERHGIYRANPRHLRDRARVLALSGRVEDAAADIAEYVRDAFDGLPGRTLASVICQVHEVDLVSGRATADEFVAALHRAANGVEDGPLGEVFSLLATRPDRWQPDDLAGGCAGITPDDAASALATFRFYMADLEAFRAPA